MGNGSSVLTQELAAVKLTRTGLPVKSLAISDLFPGESVEFSFANFPANARQKVGACFSSR